MSAAPRRQVDWRRRVTAAFTEHLPLKASALLVTIAMWFVVGAREPTEEVIGVRFAPQLDSALALRDPAPVVRALVIGRPSEILKLSTTPLVIRRPIVSGEPDTLVLTLRTNDVEVPEGVEVIVRDVQPRSVTLRFESTWSRTVPVKSELVQRPPYSLAEGGVPPVRLEPESVTVRGPRVAVARVRFVPTVRDSITISDTLPHLIDLDTTGLGVTVRPPQIKATFVLPGGKRAEPPRR